MAHRIVLYLKYLDTLGGGELHALSLFKEALNYHQDASGIIISPSNSVTLDQIQQKFNLLLENVKIEQIPNLDSIPESYHRCELFINGTDRSTVRGIGKQNLLLVYFPTRFPSRIISYGMATIANLASKCYRIIPSSLISKAANLLSKYGPNDFYKSYEVILSNSQFTSAWIERYWETEATLLYPSVDIAGFGAGTNTPKREQIIAVGRFFKPSTVIKAHNKRQDILINAFKKLIDQNPNLKHLELHLAGSVRDIAADKEYVKELQLSAKGYNIVFHLNPSFEALKALYASSKVFWHATGYGIDEESSPKQMEHFGITTVEALASGCLPVVINKGGQPEIVSEGINGFLFDTIEDLVGKTAAVFADSVGFAPNKLSRSVNRFGPKKFQESCQKIFANLSK